MVQRRNSSQCSDRAASAARQRISSGPVRCEAPQASETGKLGGEIRTLVLEVNGSPKSPMLVIVGMILLLTWTFDYALHLAPSSLVNLLLLFASISFVLDFMRERENLRHPRPGWDAMPPKGWFANSVRRVRHKMNASSSGDRAPKSGAVDEVEGDTGGVGTSEVRRNDVTK